jgi:gliding motility-associated protein GldL
MAGTSSKKDRLLNIFVSVGAAVVIFGAWAKILHLSFADTMLTVGLLTEAAIFLVYAFLPPPGNEMAPLVEVLKGKTGDSMQDVPALNPANLKRLSENISKFNDSVGQIKEIADVQAATSDYTQKTKEAAAALVAVKDSYQQAANTMGQFSSAAEGTRQFHEQVNTLTKNLGSLNTIYELELQDTNNHLKAMNSFYGNLVQASQTMQSSVEDAKKAQEQIAQLSKNLSNLNTVYGNMLAAMQGR